MGFIFYNNMKIKLNVEEFTEKAKIIHGNAYDYSLVNYLGTKVKVNIICKQHGVFSQTPSDHFQGQGCPSCGKISSIESRKKTKEEFIEKSRITHGDLYDYSLVDYKNTRYKIEIVCKIHGVFKQTPEAHARGQGCAKCGKLAAASKITRTEEDFINLAKNVHGDTYDYSELIYRKSKGKVRIICKTHGVFEQVANSHINGSGCRLCSIGTTGFNRSRFIKLFNKNGCGILYVVHLYNESESFIKIGVTTRTVKHRIVDFPYETIILHEKRMLNGGEMFDLEKHLHRVFGRFKYKPSIDFNGAGECFCKLSLDDVLYEIANYERSLNE